MKDRVQNLAGGYRIVERSTIKMEFGCLTLWPYASVGSHEHKDADGFRHCEIYLTFSRKIHVNGKYRFFTICRNSEHEARNISSEKSGKIFFLKMWW